MNKKSHWALTLTIFLLASLMSLSACSDDGKVLTKSKEKLDLVQEEQIKTIDKPKEISKEIVKESKTVLQDVTGLYKELPAPQPTRTDNKIEVLEIFWYGCPHCYQFEPTIEKWLTEKASYIEFVRMPGVLGKNWLPHARAYYVAEKLGILDKIHDSMFTAIHKEKRQIIDVESIREFFVEQGVNGEVFDEAYQSRDIEESVRYAFTMGQRYQLTGVPAVIINGKYSTSVSMAGGYNKIMNVINTLAAKEYGKLNR